jgi:hypothetical protein
MFESVLDNEFIAIANENPYKGKIEPVMADPKLARKIEIFLSL